MEKVNVSIGNSRENLLQLHDQSSKRRRKIAITVSFLILFTFTICSIVSVFAVLKHDIESQSLSESPSKAIRSVCSVTPFPYECFDTIWDLQTANEMTIKNPSEIFLLSVRVASFELDDLISVTHMQISQNSRTRLALSLNRCEILFNGSLVLLQKTMELMDRYSGDGHENIFKENGNIIFVLQKWMSDASRNLERCVNGTGNSEEDLSEVRMMKDRLEYTSKPYIENSLTMLLKMDAILDMFDPSLQSILGNLLLSSPEYAFTITLFSSQYLVIIVLIFMVLRLYS